MDVHEYNSVILNVFVIIDCEYSLWQNAIENDKWLNKCQQNHWCGKYNKYPLKINESNLKAD